MKRKHISAAVVMAMFCGGAYAQSGTNSPYSQYGLGILSDQTAGFNRGMNGLGLGFHEHNQINFSNPASYSALDSLTFIFDAGLSGQLTNFKEGGNKKNAQNADFEYVVAGFRAFKHVGVSFGLIPFTNVGYSYSLTQKVGDDNNTVATNSYSGNGGIHQVYLGVGWQPVRGLSVGVNGSYIYGEYTKTVVNSYSDGYANSLTKNYMADVRSYKVDFGLQYTARLTKKDQLTLGFTYGLGHKIGGKPTMEIISNNAQTGVADTTRFPKVGQADLELELPTTYGAGLMYDHNNAIKVGLDYTLQKWGSVKTPFYETSGATMNDYSMKAGFYKDRHKFTLGAEICPQEYGMRFLQRVHYRAGVSYATPYYIINGQDGPKEMSASIGFGFPIFNKWNNRSILNISCQWVQQTAKNYITDNTFRINVGLTFNERWFAKWKVK